MYLELFVLVIVVILMGVAMLGSVGAGIATVLAWLLGVFLAGSLIVDVLWNIPRALTKSSFAALSPVFRSRYIGHVLVSVSPSTNITIRARSSCSEVYPPRPLADVDSSLAQS